jgi:hypothetical protein
MSDHIRISRAWTRQARASWRWRPAVLLVAALALGAPSPPTALANPGDLDPTFGEGGVATTTCSGFLAQYPDGGLAVAGTVLREHPSLGPPFRTDLCVARHRLDGPPDPDFGNDGTVIVDLAEAETLQAAVLQPGGRLVLGARTPDPLLVRLSPDGNLDETFGQGGRVAAALQGRGARIGALAVQPDGLAGPSC